MSYKEACRRGWFERAALEQRFQLAEPETGSGSVQPLTDIEIANLATKFLREMEQSQSAVPFDETEQAELHKAIDEEASHFGHRAAAEDPVLQDMAYSLAQSQGVSPRADLDRFRFFEAIQAAMLEHLQRRSM